MGTGTAHHSTEMAKLLLINKVSYKYLLVCRQHNNYLRKIVNEVVD